MGEFGIELEIDGVTFFRGADELFEMLHFPIA